MAPLQRPQPCRADGRRGAHGAFRHRLGHQAGAGGRHRADAPVQACRATRRTRSPACWRATRTCARGRCRCASRTRRATRWSGSRSSARAIATSCRPSSSCIRCSRAASASATRTCACATRPGSRATSAGSHDRGPAVAVGRRRAAAARCSRPFTLRGMTVPNRIVVSPMAMYSAQDGVPNDFHLVHFGSRALGGAGLVFGEMTCVVAGRAHHARLPRPVERRAGATPGGASSISCTATAARRWASSSAMPAARARRSSAGRARDEPLDEGNWPLVSASAIPYGPHSQVPREMTRADMDRVKADFVRRRAARRRGRLRHPRAALRARLPAVELPVAADQPARATNTAAAIENRARYPLEVFPRDPRRLAGGPADLGAPVLPRLVSRAATRPTMR